MAQLVSDVAGGPAPVFTGALVGWQARQFNGRILAQLQGVTSSPPHGPGDVADLCLLLDPRQAVQLGETLFAIAEASVPARPRRRWLERMLAP